MRNNSRIVLLDVGGTFVKSSLGIAGQGAVEGTFLSTPISSDGSAEEIETSFREAVSLQVSQAKEAGLSVEAVCAALPGPFNYAEGVFMMKHKFASVYGRSFRDILGETIGPEVRLAFVHDVNGALLGALTADESFRKGNVALTTFGTGLGFAYAVDGVIQKSRTGSPAVNLWNAAYEDGILEDYVSRRAILRYYDMLGGVLEEGEDVKEIAAKADAGDQNALEAFRTAARHYARGARETLERLQIRHVLFGGQIARSFGLMDSEIRKGIPENVQISVLEDIQGTVLIGITSL